LLGAGAAASAAGAYLLAWNLWKTLDRAAQPVTRIGMRPG